jgi:hypothetical protein
MTTTEPTRENLLAALQAVREAIGIPNGATTGDQETRDKILVERAGHAAVMLDSILDDKHPSPDRAAWSVEYLRARLAEHPAEGYKTWQQRVAELEAAEREVAKPAIVSGPLDPPQEVLDKMAARGLTELTAPDERDRG